VSEREHSRDVARGRRSSLTCVGQGDGGGRKDENDDGPHAMRPEVQLPLGIWLPTHSVRLPLVDALARTRSKARALAYAVLGSH